MNCTNVRVSYRLENIGKQKIGSAKNNCASESNVLSSESDLSSESNVLSSESNVLFVVLCTYNSGSIPSETASILPSDFLLLMHRCEYEL